MVRAQQRLERAASNWDKANGKVEKSRLEVSLLQDCAKKAVEDIAPMLKKILIANFNGSEFARGTPNSEWVHTGKIREAIENVTVGGSFKMNKPWKIFYLLPASMPPYTHKSKKGKSTTANFYVVFGALNWGAVIPPKNQKFSTPQKKKVELKKKAAEEAKWGMPGPVSRSTKIMGPSKIKRGYGPKQISFTVIEPKKFFYLTTSQAQEIMARWMERFETYFSLAFGV